MYNAIICKDNLISYPSIERDKLCVHITIPDDEFVVWQCTHACTFAIVCSNAAIEEMST